MLGGLTGLITYVASRLAVRRHATARQWTGKTRGGKFGNGCIKVVLKYCGLKWGYRCLSFLVPYFFVFAPKATRSSLEYWKVRDPKLSLPQRVWLVMRHYQSFGTVLMDRLYQSFHKESIFQSNPHGFEHILQAAANETGSILVGAHVGGFDLALRYMEKDGMDRPFHSLQYGSEGQTFAKVMQKESMKNIHTLFTNFDNQPIFLLHELLRDGKIVGLMADRPVSSHYELVKFMGHLALIDIAPFRIAATHEVPLIFSLGFKGKGKKYDFFAAEPVLIPKDGDRDQRFLEAAQSFAEYLEIHLRNYPDQWFNFYPSFSTAP